MSDAGDSGAQQQGPQCALQRLYIKDLSFESPKSPEIFSSNWQPNINLQLNTSQRQYPDDLWEVVLQLTLTAKNERDTAFIIEIQQAGLFKITGHDAEQLGRTLHIFCPDALFPYARECVDSAVVRGSFPPLMLQAVNFDALFAEARRRVAAGEDRPPIQH